MAEEGFLGRWSRLKRGEPPPQESPAAAPPAKAEADSAPPAEAPPEEESSLRLPDISSLTKDSDFTVFLRAGVPEELRRQALRKLWRSDPVLANLDGLNDYEGDFQGEALGKLVRTAYRVGKGYLEAAEPEGEGNTAVAKSRIDESNGAVDEGDTLPGEPNNPYA